MSTTIKRVALVAVAALGLGVVSVAPSQATTSSVTFTVADGTAKLAGTTLTADTTTAAVVSVSALFDAYTTDSITVQVVQKSVPTDASVTTLLGNLDTTTSTDSIVKLNGATAQYESATVVNTVGQLTSGALGYAGGKFSIQLQPSGGTYKAGTYTYTVIVKTLESNVVKTTTAKDVNIVVTSASTLADATSVALLTAGKTIDPAAYITAGLTTDSVTVATKATGSTAAGLIYVKQKNADATASPAEAMTAVITGPGSLLAGANVAAFNTATTGTGRAITVTAGQYIGVYSDGASGEATITVTGNKSGVVLATKKVTFFDTKPASVTVAVKKAFVEAKTAATADVFLVTVKDAAGNPVTSIATLTAGPTDTSTAQTVGGASTCSTTYNSVKGGYYCNVAGLSATKFGKVNYTFVATGSDALATEVKGTADVTFSSRIATTITIVPAATAANPGDVVTYTYTATDKNGYAVPDGTYNNADSTYTIFDSVVASGFATAPFAKGDTITTVNGVATSKGTLAIAGTAKITWTLAGSATTPADTTSLAKALNAVDVAAADVAISNPGVDAATDAANEAAQAASDATDAALAAADAADAATTKAQEAVDAVATLSAEVSKLITALKAQITTLTNLVIKIQKKVKA